MTKSIQYLLIVAPLIILLIMSSFSDAQDLRTTESLWPKPGEVHAVCSSTPAQLLRVNNGQFPVVEEKVDGKPTGRWCVVYGVNDNSAEVVLQILNHIIAEAQYYTHKIIQAAPKIEDTAVNNNGIRQYIPAEQREDLEQESEQHKWLDDWIKTWYVDDDSPGWWESDDVTEPWY